MTLRRRFTLTAAAAVAIAIVAASVLTYVIARAELLGQVDDGLRRLAGEVVPPQIALPPGDPPSFEAGPIGLPAPPPGGSPGYAQIVGADGSVVRPLGSDEVDLPANRAAVDVASGARPAFFSDMTVDNSEVRVYTRALGDGRAVQVVRPLDEVEGTLERLALVLVLVSIGGIGLAAGLGLLVSRAALRPVARLTATAEDVARTGDLSRRIDATGDDELSRLARSFTTMLGALDGARSAQRQLVADASHELRTPLTALRTNLELLDPERGLPDAERERLRRDVLAQLEELSLLVGDLVDLARGPEPEHEVEDLRLDELVAYAVDRARRHAPGRTFELDLEPCIVRAGAGRLHRAVANLLANAVEWGPAGAPVEVRLADGRLVVRDHGPGIHEADLGRIFDRFYRSRAARGRPGSGLGLAIVRQIAEAHGGTVEAANAPSGGALLTLRLPVEPPPPAEGAVLAAVGGARDAVSEKS